MNGPDSSSPATPPSNQPGAAGPGTAKQSADTLTKKLNVHAFSKQETFRALPRLGLVQMADQDRALENELLLLLSNLDYYRSQLANPQTRLRPATALKIVTEMVDQVAGLAERHPRPDPIRLLYRKPWPRPAACTDSAQEFSRELNSSGSKGFLSLFNRRSREEQHPEMLRQLTLSLVEVLDSFFLLFKGRFRSSAPAEVWSQAYSLFLHDLAQVIERLYSC